MVAVLIAMIIFWLLTPFLVLSIDALPFRTRGGKAGEEDGTGNEGMLPTDAIVVNDGDVMTISRQIPRRNNMVELFFAGSNSNGQSLELRDEIRSKANNITDFLVNTRRTLHQHPELMFNEEETSKTVQRVLHELNVPYTTGWSINTNQDVFPGKGGYGVVADIGTGKQPCVLLRADMDALPILERTEGIDSFKSRNDGRMHACGHDGHTTMLLGAVAILKEMEDSINGTIRIMFQPAEEGGAGAKRMIEEGLLEMDPKPSYAFGMHLWPMIPSGTIGSRAGPLLAAAERFEVLIAGVGGHAAMPHLTVDPIVTASSIVMNLQTLVSRTLNPLESGVCSVTKLEAGDAFNIIPASAVMRGTIRALTTETLLVLKKRVQHVVTTTAAVHGCNVSITYSPDYYPPTKNDEVLFETFSKQVGALVSREGTVRIMEPTMGAEDFAFIAEKVPATFFLLGQGSGANPPTNYGLHHPHFAIDESVLPRGVELHVNLALRALRKLATKKAAVVAEQ